MLANLCLESCNNPGSNSSITLLGAAAGRRSFNTCFGIGPNFYYTMIDGTNIEWGVGVLTAASTMTRTTVLGNSAGTTARMVFSGATTVFNTLPAERAVYRDNNLRLQMASQRIEGLAASAGADHAVRQDQVVLLAGSTMSGALTTSRLNLDATAYLTIQGSDPLWALDANDYMLYGRSTNTLSFVVGASNKFYLNATDIVASSPLTLNVAGSTAAHAVRLDQMQAGDNARLALTGGTVSGNLVVTGTLVNSNYIQTYNSASTGTGVVYFNSNNTKWLQNDGSAWQLNAQPLYVNGSLVWTAGNLDPAAGRAFSGNISAPNISTAGTVAATGNISTSAGFIAAGDANISGRVLCNSPRAGGAGYAIGDNTGRFGPWGWNDGGTYVGIDVDGVSRGIATFSSDERVKEAIVPASEPVLPLIRQIEFIDFKFKRLPDAPADLVMPTQKGGISAQQVKTIRSEWVDEMADEPGTLIPNVQLLLTNALQAIQELDAQVQALTARLGALRQ